MNKSKRYTKHPATQIRFAVLDDGNGKRSFIKSYPSESREHFRRGQLLHEIGNASGIFHAPAPIAFVPEARLAIWEYLEKPLSFRDVLMRSVLSEKRDESLRRELANLAGRALATIHSGFSEFERPPGIQPIELLRSDATPAYRRLAEAVEESPTRAAHGDFTVTNLFLGNDGAGRQLVVIDPAPNPYLFKGAPASVTCPVAVECALWYYSLRFHRASSRLLAREAQSLLDGFLAGYHTRSGFAPDSSTVQACSALIALQYLSHFRRKPIWDISSTLDRLYRIRTAKQILANTSSPDGPA